MTHIIKKKNIVGKLEIPSTKASVPPFSALQ